MFIVVLLNRKFKAVIRSGFDFFRFPKSTDIKEENTDSSGKYNFGTPNSYL